MGTHRGTTESTLFSSLTGRGLMTAAAALALTAGPAAGMALAGEASDDSSTSWDHESHDHDDEGDDHDDERGEHDDDRDGDDHDGDDHDGDDHDGDDHDGDREHGDREGGDGFGGLLDLLPGGGLGGGTGGVAPVS